MNSDVLQSILGSKVVSFHSIFAKAIGSVPAAVMLSQGLFWQEKSKHKDPRIIDGEEYFSKTAEEWYDETGVTEEQQKTARAHLVGCSVWKERRAGLPAKMYFRVDLENLVAVISRYLNEGKPVRVDNRNKKREITRTGSGKNPGQFAVINGSIIIESNESDGELKRDIPTASPVDADERPSKAKKKKEKSAPQAGGWTMQAATAFDEVDAAKCVEYGIDYSPFNWKVCSGQNFGQLSNLMNEGIIPDFKKKYNREPDESEKINSMKAVFERAWQYFFDLSKTKGGVARNYTPTSIYKGYNTIKIYKGSNANYQSSNSQGRHSVQPNAFNSGAGNVDPHLRF
jgi:hypothetical protein